MTLAEWAGIAAVAAWAVVVIAVMTTGDRWQKDDDCDLVN